MLAKGPLPNNEATFIGCPWTYSFISAVMRPSLVFFAMQGFHQLGVVQSGAEGDRGDGDEHGRVGCELDESAVPVLDRLGDRLAEPHAVAQALRKYSTVCTGVPGR